MKTYYAINEGINPNQIYGRDTPVCLGVAEVARLSLELDINLFEQMHEANVAEIAKYGTYDGDCEPLDTWQNEVLQNVRSCGVGYYRRLGNRVDIDGQPFDLFGLEFDATYQGHAYGGTVVSREYYDPDRPEELDRAEDLYWHIWEKQ